jgi:hypothetical protein
MNILVTVLLTLCVSVLGQSQQADSVETGSLTYHSLRVIARVADSTPDYMLIVIERVTETSPGLSSMPQDEEEIWVRLPGRDMPRKETRIEADLQEKIEVGAMPSSYILLGYRTIE